MTNTVRVQFPVLTVLTLIFVTLKLTGYIAWSWWWVLSPLWLPFAALGGLFIVIGGIFALGILLAASLQALKSKRSRVRDSYRVYGR